MGSDLLIGKMQDSKKSTIMSMLKPPQLGRLAPPVFVPIAAEMTTQDVNTNSRVVSCSLCANTELIDAVALFSVIRRAKCKSVVSTYY
jgi:hypothetical protein